MKKYRLTIPITVFILSVSAAAAAVWMFSGESASAYSPAEQRRYSLHELQEDYRQFRVIIRDKHPMLFADEDRMTRLLDDRYELLRDGMTELEFYRILSSIASQLNCGHTNVMVSKEYEAFLKAGGKFIPFHVRVADERLFVRSPDESESFTPPLPPGTELLTINGRQSSAILEGLYAQLSSDGMNETRKAAMADHQFPLLYHTNIDSAGRFTVRYTLPGSTVAVEQQFEGVAFDRIMDKDSRLVSNNLFMNSTEIKRDYGGAIYDTYAVLEAGSFILNQRGFSSFLADFFREVESRQITHLVLDLRGNWGGPPWPAAELLAYLIEEPVRYFDGEAPFYLFKYKRPQPPAEDAFDGSLYVLTDGACFSTTAHLLSLLRYHTSAVFLGEESGGSYICSDGHRKTVLRNTGLRFFYSTQVFAAAVPGCIAGRGIMPDLEVVPSVEDLVTESDPVMMAAQRMIE